MSSASGRGKGPRRRGGGRHAGGGDLVSSMSVLHLGPSEGGSSNSNSQRSQSYHHPPQSSSLPSTPLSAISSSRNKISMNGTTLLYQYKRSVKIPSALLSPLPPRGFDLSHRPLRLGLGSASGNLKTYHIVNIKSKETLVPPESLQRRRFKRGSENITNSKTVPPPAVTGLDIGLGLTPTPRIKLTTIYESPKSSRDFSSAYNGNGESSSRTKNGTSCRINPTESVTGKVFITLNKKANYIASLQRKTTFNLGDGRLIEVQPTRMISNEEEVNGNREISRLTRHFRNILGWKMSLHMSWKYVEDRIKNWYSESPEIATIEEISELLKIPVERLRNFDFDDDMENVFNVLRKNLCHVNFANYAKLLGLQRIQKGMPESSTRYFAQQSGAFLESEIIDKHLTFIRRSEENKADEGYKAKLDIFWRQVNHTLDFSNWCFDANDEKEFKNLSSFDPNWNIVQISTAFRSDNRFGYDVVDKRCAPALILTAMGFFPGCPLNRAEFTAVCPKPNIEPATSSMRHGIIEAFNRLLDKNLMISDEKVGISRKKYWEERAKHNEVMDIIMNAMEDWISPWVFLLAGKLQDKSIQKRITKELFTHPALNKCSDSQKFLIYRLTEGYCLLPSVYRSVLDTFVAYILGLKSENADVSSLSQIISDIGSSISPTEPRHPTIFILDQEIDILPWDWLPCMRSTTAVTRMPSLNLIKGTQLLNGLINGEQNIRMIEKDRCTFVLNPDGSLPQVQARLETYLTDRNSWKAVIGRSPSPEEMEVCLENQDVFLYCGHGSGSNMYPEYAVQKLICKAVPILMGCSSAQSQFAGPGFYSYSSVHAYFIAGSAAVIGFLWEVTDTECDRITVEFLERWLPHPCAKLPKMPMFDSQSEREHEEDLASAWKTSRTAATQFLTQCAGVCYGLPIVKVF